MDKLIRTAHTVKGNFLRLTIVQKLVIFLLLVGVAWYAYAKIFSKKGSAVQYQTAVAEKGTLIVTVTGSGSISSANNAQVLTQASGVVSKVYVRDGDQVKAGDPIADVDLDLIGKQRADSSYASYQSAKNAVDTAQLTMYTLQSGMFSQWKTFTDLANSGAYTNSDGSPRTDQRTLPAFITSQDDWLAAEAKYKMQQNVIAQAQTALSSAWLTYQQSSPTIVAPIPGVVSGLSLQPGTVIPSNQSSGQSTSATTTSSSGIASIITDAKPTVTLNLTEIDVPNVKVGNKATITIDAYPDRTFTGTVISVDTVGSVSSNVTSYPTVIALDTDAPGILPNMGATAGIVTKIKDNVLLVPSAAVTTQNGTSTVRLFENGKVTQVEVEVGSSNDTQTEVTSGLKTGDTVVTGTTGGNAQTNTTSVFSPFGGGRGGGATFRAIRN